MPCCTFWPSGLFIFNKELELQVLSWKEESKWLFFRVTLLCLCESGPQIQSFRFLHSWPEKKEGRNQGDTHGPGWISLKVHFICTKIEPGWWAVRREDTHSRGTLYWEHLSTLSCAHFLSQAGLINIPRGNVTVLVWLLFFFQSILH